MLNENDLHRYARQIIIQNFDEEGQEKILKTKCLIVGAGGLGCPVALYAAAAGFGHIEIYSSTFLAFVFDFLEGHVTSHSFFHLAIQYEYPSCC